MKSSVRIKIEAALTPLIGEPLTDMWRYIGFQKFEFGLQKPFMNRKGIEVSKADHGLVTNGEWKLTDPEGKSISRQDFESSHVPPNPAVLAFLENLLDRAPKVTEITTGPRSYVKVFMTEGFSLELSFLSSARGCEWRYISPDRSSDHFVVMRSGIKS